MVDASDLFRYYQHNFELVKLKMFSLSELEDMLPFERYVYISMVEDWSKDIERNKSKGN